MIYKTELYHHGVKGMRWGVRKDKQYSSPIRPKKKVEFNPEEAKKYRAALDDATTVANSSSDFLSKRHYKKNFDLSNMTDDDLRDAISRKRLENEYGSMMSPSSIGRGRAFISETLATVGSVLAISSSAVALANSINQLRGKAVS